MEKVTARFENPCRFLNKTSIVVTCESIRRNRYHKFFAFTWIQKHCFSKADKHFFRLPQLSLRGFTIKLDNLPSYSFSDVGYQSRKAKTSLFRNHAQFRERKGCIRKPESEGITYLLRSTGYGFKIPVTDVNIFCILHIIL